MTVESFDWSPAQCRARIEQQLGSRAPHALRRLGAGRPRYPRLIVLAEDRVRAVEAYQRRCAYCGGVGDEREWLDVDFLVPQKRGGTDHPENLVAACEGCREDRREQHLDAFLARRLDLDARCVYARIARATVRLRADATRDRRAS